MEAGKTQFLTTDYGINNADKFSIPYLSAVSWGAILAGATAAAALSLIILLLGVGLGLSAVSPWANSGISGTAFGISTIVWITVTSMIASALGGYIAGRLRTRWLSTNGDEVYFRDTAHGFLSWAVATLVTASLLTSAISTVLGGAAQTGATFAGAGVATAAMTAGVNDSENLRVESGQQSLNYLIDALLRTDAATANNVDANNTSLVDAQSPNSGTDINGNSPSNNTNMNGANSRSVGRDTEAPRIEFTRIFINGLAANALPPSDLRYAANVVAQRTGLTQAEAERRVAETFTTLQTKVKEAQAAADKARKASAYSALWIFIALLMSAFVASLAAVYGGRQRDL